MNKKILILNHHGIGDVLMNVPLIKTLHNQNFEIDMTFKSKLEQSLIEPMNIVKKSYLYDFRRKKFPNNIINLILFMNQLRKEKYDIGFSTCGTSVFYSKLLFKFLGIKKIIISEESAESNNHKSKINLHLLTQLKIHRDDFIDDFSIQFPKNFKSFSVPKNYICLHPGSGPFETHKRMKLKDFKKIFNLIPEMNFIITGSEIEKEQCEELFNVAKYMNVNIKNYCSKMDIFQTAFLIRKSSFIIGGDSGILHLANSVNTPVIGFFGPTNSKHTGPINKNNIFIHDTKCQCKYPQINDGCDCMNNFSTYDIETAINSINK